MSRARRDFDKRTDFGNFESNLTFLNETGILNKGKKYLEIGSGTGRMLNFFHEKAYDIMGVEMNWAYIEKSREIYGDIPISKVKSVMLPFEDKTFDIVMSFDVFEHIPDSDTHLKEVNRVLKDNGYYVLQTPNKYTNAVFETIRWKSFTKWKEDHCSLHSYWGILERFGRCGFDVEFYEIPVVDEFFKSKVYRYLGGVGLFSLKILNPDKLPMALKTNFYIKAKKIAKTEADYNLQAPS